MMTQLFQLFLDASFVPRAWKETTIIPVPKKPHAKSLNDFRPVALSPLSSANLWRELLQRNSPPWLEKVWIRCSLPIKTGCGGCQSSSPWHCDKESFVRILFMDFSSAFNTVIINTLLHHLQQLQVNRTLMLWIKEFLMNRPQHVRVHGVTSTNNILNTGMYLVTNSLFYIHKWDHLQDQWTKTI